ncbi:hypothetical protein F5888DRAFT_1633096 [Russula emetica]|nr:hypothetical protein F5888DRAFT_1633096 [Russula emetica]
MTKPVIMSHPHPSVLVSSNRQLAQRNRVLQQITATGHSSLAACPLTHMISCPEFLQQSLLGDKRARLIVKAIRKVIGRLPSPDTEEERPKEKELDGGAKVSKAKARAGQKKLAARKDLTHTPSLAPSTSGKVSVLFSVF